MAKATSKTTKSAAKPIVKPTVAKSVKVDRPKENRNMFAARFQNELTPQSLLTEMIGTFILVSSVVITSGDAFFTGLTMLVLAGSMMAISGAHVNPAVTFGLWTMRKISGVKVPFYMLAQFVGAIAALLVLHLFSGAKLDLSLSSFFSFDSKIFFAELIGSAVYLFGLAAAINRGQTDSAKAVGVGLSLFLGLIIATGFLSQAVQSVSTATDASSPARLQKVNNVALNPAVALALTERDTASQTTSTGDTPVATTQPSRLTIETIFGTLLGAAIGGNLYVILSGTRRNQDER